MSESNATGRLRCVALSGPTASGKSAASLAVAQRWPVEIVSVDSALVYRGMDIGTAKPSSDELAQVPHHLIDIIDPSASYSAARFLADAQRLIAEIQARGRTPLLVGGTLLYIKALMQGMDDMPPADPAVRARIESQALERGWPAMHAELERVDPITASRLSPNDSQRIQRALEVHALTGRPLSSLHTGAGQPEGPLEPQRLIAMEPTDRAWLHERIAQRFDAMLGQGLVAEVQRLRQQPGVHADLPSMRCVGYRQTWEMLDAAGPGGPTPAQMSQLREQGIAATRQLAKRQLTWLRSMPQRRVVPCDAPDALARVLQSVQDLLGPPP